MAKRERTCRAQLCPSLPGQLRKLTRRMAEAGVNIEVLYSDHAHQLILVVDDYKKAESVKVGWTREIWRAKG